MAKLPTPLLIAANGARRCVSALTAWRLNASAVSAHAMAGLLFSCDHVVGQVGWTSAAAPTRTTRMPRTCLIWRRVLLRSLANIGDPVACYLRREPQRRQTSVQRKPGNTYAHAQDDCSLRMQFHRCRSLWHRFESRSTRAHCAQAMTQSNVLRKAASTPLRAR